MIALLRRDQREPEAGVAGGRLDERVARLDVAALLGLLDHRDADAVLDRAARIHEFELQEQAAWACIDMRHLEHRRLADHVENIGIHVHGRISYIRNFRRVYSNIEA